MESTKPGTMPSVRANGLTIHYDEIGEGEPALLVAGLGMQLIGWDDEFCDRLAARGFRVIRFDNRDVGLSSWLDHLPTASMAVLFWQTLMGLPIRPPYSLDDMAGDAVGLLDALGIASAHVIGVSMGGMIAQSMAIQAPRRVRSLTSIMSHPGDGASKVPEPRALRVFLGPRSVTRDQAIRRYIDTFRTIGSPGLGGTEDGYLRRRAERAYDRSFHPRGIVRQTAAVVAAGNRIRALGRIQVPTLVLHGSRDPLVPPRGGRATARAIPGATLRIIPGMGHDLPPGAWPIIIDAITELAAGRPSRAAVP